MPASTIQHFMPCLNFCGTTTDVYVSIPNGRGSMTPAGLKVKAAIASAEIKIELVCPWGHPAFFDSKRHNLLIGVSKCMITRSEQAQARFNECRETRGSHGEVYTCGSNIKERVAESAVNHHLQSGETTCCHLSKRLSDNSTIIAA